MIRNKFHGRCSDCGCRVPAEAGWLGQKNAISGRWRIYCNAHKPGPSYRADTGPRWTPPPNWNWEDDPIIREARRLRAERGDFWWLADRPSPPIPQCLQVLGLHPPTDAESIRQRYRTMAHQHHPDHGGSQAEFIRIKRAYDEALALVGGAA